MFFTPDNHVKIAIAKSGGPTKVSNQLSLSNGTIHVWIKKGRIANIDYARQVSEMSGVSVDLLRRVL